MTNLAFETEPEEAADAPAPAIRPVPRVSIQAFCEQPETTAALEEAAQDRRMAKAQCTVQTGGVAAAVEFYASAPTPNVIIVETLASADTMLGTLERLAEVCDPSTRVVIIGHVNDVGLYRELMRSGVSQYVVAPVTPMQAVATISELYADAGKEPVGRTVAFIGARGGVGSSTVAHNVAWSISTDFRMNAVIADMDLAFGTAGLDFNQDPALGLADAVFQQERIDEQLLDRLLFKCTDRLSLFAAPSSLEREYDLAPETFGEVLDLARASIPCLVLDLPHLWTGWARRTLVQADEIVITATPDLASLRNARNLVETLKGVRKHDAPPRLVLNQVGVPKRPEITPDDFAAALGCQPTAIIAFDPQTFGTAANNGQMIAEMNASAKAVESFRSLAQLVAGRSEARKGRASPLAAVLDCVARLMKKG